jgi:alpha-L-fucosidase 2
MGVTAGVAEMLLQSHQGFIELLPALPTEWHTGSVKGLCARGAFETDMNWNNGELSYVVLYAKKGGPVTVRYAGLSVSLQTKAGETVYLDSKLKMINKKQRVVPSGTYIK